MSEPEDYFDNEIMQQHIRGSDRAIDAYIAARGRKDVPGMIAALRILREEDFDVRMKNRKGKIDKGMGHRAMKVPLPPKSVRVMEVEEA